MMPEACLPLSAPFDIPVKMDLTGSKNQSILVELLIPPPRGPESIRGEITVTANARRIESDIV